ncbi:MAG TPA: FAD:protein FMN transferase [Atribacteraceae bacterium]|nr:FAD:protein FMN transferase [Atribacteraceae bacterium]
MQCYLGNDVLGGIAKGYLVDVLQGLPKSRRVFSTLINAGGAVYALERAARVDISHLREVDLIGTVVLSPFDGYPNPFSGVIVASKTTTESGILFTAVLAGGRGAFRLIVESFPKVAILAMTNDRTLIMNPQSAEIFIPFSGSEEKNPGS